MYCFQIEPTSNLDEVVLLLPHSANEELVEKETTYQLKTVACAVVEALMIEKLDFQIARDYELLQELNHRKSSGWLCRIKVKGKINSLLALDLLYKHPKLFKLKEYNPRYFFPVKLIPHGAEKIDPDLFESIQWASRTLKEIVSLVITTQSNLVGIDKIKELLVSHLNDYYSELRQTIIKNGHSVAFFERNIFLHTDLRYHAFYQLLGLLRAHKDVIKSEYNSKSFMDRVGSQEPSTEWIDNILTAYRYLGLLPSCYANDNITSAILRGDEQISAEQKIPMVMGH